MRIIAGEVGGRKLLAPKGRDIRPTSDRVRGALFNILGPLPGGKALDLFAGTGALGLEALSRGAETAMFVDQEREATALVLANADALGLASRVEVRAGDWKRALKAFAAEGRRFDWVFMDPPYREYSGEALLDPELWRALLPEGAALSLETGAKEDIAVPTDWTLKDRRRYGDTALWLLAWKG